MRDRKMMRDPHRPQYHYLPPANWMNDPNGLIQWQGDYHLFYQYNPYGPYWGTIHWGHAVSRDLVHWADLPIALEPTPGAADEDGCWSGCAVDNRGIPTLIYTGSRGNTDPASHLPCLATSRDGLTTWEKHPGNPVIASPPPDLDVVGFRDHTVWREGDAWYQIIGSGFRDVGGAVLLYRSPDLVRWEYLHPLHVGDKRQTGEMWECPDFFPMGDRHFLLVSPVPLRKAFYFVGRYANHRFVPESGGILDFGGHFYAPQTMLDDAGRRLMWGWLWEGRSDQAQHDAGWAGVMSLPRVLSMGSDDALCIAPAPELKTLRDEYYQFADVQLTPKPSDFLTGVQGDALELLAEFELEDAEVVGVKVRCSPDGAEQTLITYDRLTGRLEIDRGQASLAPDVQRDRQGGSLTLAPQEKLKLHIFVDRSVVEVFGNNRTCVTSRIYPTRLDSLNVLVFVRGGGARLTTLDVWTMRSIWMHRR